MRTKKTRKHQILSFFLAVLMIFTMLPVTAFAAGNVVYTNGVEGSGWPYDKAYINTITLGGAEVKRYTWTSSDICNVELVAGTAADAEITVSITKSGTLASRMSAKLNGVGISTSETIQLVDGKLENVPLYVDGIFKKATKTFNFKVAEENKLPTLADSSVTGEEATMVGTEGYQINLKNLFTDADAADTLTYLVSVNGAEAVNAPVDEEGIYTYETKFAGTYVLVFTAKDSKGDSSTDTYTTTLTVENSKNTYEMTVALPSDVTPVFYTNAGFGDDGIPVNGEVLVSGAGETSEEIVTYTIQVPENVSEINVCTENYGGMSVEVSENAALTMRKVQMLAEDLFGAPVSAAVKVTYGENHTAIGAENQYLLLTGENYTFTATPQDTKNFKTAVSSKILESGTDNAVISALVDYQNLKTITAPMGAEVELYRYNQYYDNTQIQLRGTKDNGNGTGTSYFAGADGTGIIYRVKYEDYILKTGYTNGNKTITFSEKDLKEDARVDYTQSKENNAGFTDDGVLLNINRQNYLTMSKGTSKTLKAYRAWEIIPVSYNNWILEPDFHFAVVWESEDGVISLSDKPNNMTGGDSWKTLKAEKEGTAVIEVTYDAADVRGGNYDGVYNATDPARTGLVVVQVGGSTANVNFGIDGKASMGNVVYEKSTPKAWDAEFDTLYFAEEFGELNFTPTVETGTIEKVEVSNDKGISWTTLDSVDGKYTAKIISGNNILKVTTDSGVSYQVVRGDRLTYTIEETTAAETNNNDNDGLIEAGETVRVTVQGLHSPIPKMAGNYNPGYAQNSDGYSKHHMSYILNGERIAGAGSQYNWISDTNYIEVTLPEKEGTYRLTDGCIGVGVIGIDNFIDGKDSHRNIPDSGCTTRGSKTTFHTRSVLPEIEIYAQEKDHEHIYSEEWKYDETNHWKECRCEDKTEEAEHTFEWVTDKEATTSEAGAKHEECTVCHVKRNENTEIPMLPIPTYTVTLQNGEGYQLNPAEGAELVVKEGENFSLTVEIEEGYETSEEYKVKANETELAETEGIYVIENITEDQVVTVEGVLKHEHIYSEEWKYDETNHWKECRCEDKTEEAEHTFEWITDKEATTSEAGAKHEECTVCHVKRNENTEIPMLPAPEWEIKEVYLSISSDADYVVGKATKDVMAMKKVTVPYFDLADYGLEKFANEEGKVTVLHLLIYATEVYYCGVSVEEAGQGYLYEAGLLGTEVLSIGGKPGSLFFTNFWDLDMNMNYYVNYEYPLAYDDWGATAEQILLQDGDIVTFGRFKSWSFYEDSTSVFNYMKAGDEVVTTTAKQGDKVLLSLYHAGADMNGEKTTAHTPVYTCPDVYGTNVNDLESGVVKTWTKLGKADEQGNVIIDTKNFEPGEYLIAIEGQYGAEHKKDICSTPGGILLTVTENEDVPVTPPENPKVNEVVRISGATRYETGYKAADALKEALGVEKFEAVVVATGKNFADALAGSYLAVEKNAPIILTNGKDDNIATLHTYIKDNVAVGGKVYILGGEAAVPAAAAAIEGYEVVRLFGDSRYDTNLAILAEAGVTGDSIIIATGKTFADSLSASAAKLPILLVKPGKVLSTEVKDIVKDMKNIYIIGGEGAVSAEIAAELAAYGEVVRVAGATRYETSVAVAKTFFENVDMAVVASAKDFPDGLCGGPFAAAMNVPLILTADDKFEAAKIYMEENEIKSGYVLGGTAKITEDCVGNIFGISY